MARGYMGKILHVDLANGNLEDETLDEKILHDFIGGCGVRRPNPLQPPKTRSRSPWTRQYAGFSRPVRLPVPTPPSPPD